MIRVVLIMIIQVMIIQIMIGALLRLAVGIHH